MQRDPRVARPYAPAEETGAMRKTSPRKGRTRRRALRAVLLALSASLFAIAILLAIRDRADPGPASLARRA